MRAIRAGCVLTPLTSFAPGTVLIQGEKIVAVGPTDQIRIPEDAAVIDVADKVVGPGFIDTHVHGRDGSYFGEDLESTTQLCHSIVSSGVTSLLPTLATLLPIQYTLDMILDRIRVVREAMIRDKGGAEILGIHMEGPYLSGAETARGSQVVANLRRPAVEELHRMVDVAGGAIRKMSIAPELDGALDVIRELARLGIVACAAHSTASYEQTMQAVQAGLQCATHVFNGMVPLHHRQPGLLGAALTCDEINAELIADGQHVSPVAMKILLRCKGVDGVHLVSDNTRWAGMPNGTYQDGERTIVKEEQRAYVVGGTLAGSVASMGHCVSTLVHTVSCSLGQAIQMASLNPARVIGVDQRKGSLEPGKDADVVVLDKELKVEMTMVRGQIVYHAEQGGCCA
ncbi:MAG: N-acetylglucosamine-6-phosphate deacetylase [Anaerolineae bacterium]